MPTTFLTIVRLKACQRGGRMLEVHFIFLFKYLCYATDVAERLDRQVFYEKGEGRPVRARKCTVVPRSMPDRQSVSITVCMYVERSIDSVPSQANYCAVN